MTAVRPTIPPDWNADEEPGTRYGTLAWRFAGEARPNQVMRSAAGYYIGTDTDTGEPNTRESVEYWRKREHAETALRQRTWTQRHHL